MPSGPTAGCNTHRRSANRGLTRPTPGTLRRALALSGFPTSMPWRCDMAELSAGHTTQTTSIAWWRDERKRAIIWQLLVVAALAAVVAFIVVNMIANLRRLGVPLGFDFLDAPAGFAISFSIIPTDLESHIGRLIIA